MFPYSVFIFVLYSTASAKEYYVVVDSKDKDRSGWYVRMEDNAIPAPVVNAFDVPLDRVYRRDINRDHAY